MSSRLLLASLLLVAVNLSQVYRVWNKVLGVKTKATSFVYKHILYGIHTRRFREERESPFLFKRRRSFFRKFAYISKINRRTYTVFFFSGAILFRCVPVLRGNSSCSRDDNRMTVMYTVYLYTRTLNFISYRNRKTFGLFFLSETLLTACQLFSQSLIIW